MNESERRTNKKRSPLGNLGIGGQPMGNSSELVLHLRRIHELVRVPTVLRIRMELPPYKIRKDQIRDSPKTSHNDS